MKPEHNNYLAGPLSLIKTLYLLVYALVLR